MIYSTIKLVQTVLANALMSSTPDTGDQVGNLLNVGTSLDTNLVKEELVHSFIQDADQFINAALGQMYMVPLRKKCDFETTLLADVDGTDVDGTDASNVVTINNKDYRLTVGDRIVLTDGTNSIEHEIAAVSADQVTLTTPVTVSFLKATTRVLRIDYPSTIKYISARLAAGNIYDKFFAAQASPNDSKYGQKLRKLAIDDLNMILAGVNVLIDQPKIGYLTTNPNLVKPYSNPKGWNDNPYKIPAPGE